jgi:cell division protein FtsZ
MNALKFDLPKDKSSIIKVLGVGGGGGNAVNHMFNQGIKGVDFVICNTDLQALEASPIPNKIQLGASLTAGLISSIGFIASTKGLTTIISGFLGSSYNTCLVVLFTGALLTAVFGVLYTI